MGAATVERLLREMAEDRLVPVRYSRRSLASRSAPVLLMLVTAVAVTTLGVALGRL